METKVIIERKYVGKINLNLKMYSLILNLLMEHLLNNQNVDYNEIAKRNV